MPDRDWCDRLKGRARSIREILLRSASVSVQTPAFLMHEKVTFSDILALQHLLSVPSSFSVRCNFKGKTRWELIFGFMPCAGWSARTKERTWVGFKREEISGHNNGRRCRFRYLFITTLISFTSRQWRFAASVSVGAKMVSSQQLHRKGSLLFGSIMNASVFSSSFNAKCQCLM